MSRRGHWGIIGVVAFGFVYWGTTLMQLGSVLQQHLIPVKVGMGVLLFGLGIWLLFGIIFIKPAWSLHEQAILGEPVKQTNGKWDLNPPL